MCPQNYQLFKLGWGRSIATALRSERRVLAQGYFQTNFPWRCGHHTCTKRRHGRSADEMRRPVPHELTVKWPK